MKSVYSFILLFIILDSASVTYAQNGISTIDSAYRVDDEGPYHNQTNDEVESIPISSLLTASRDPFLSNVSFQFSFRPYSFRGYESSTRSFFINHTPMDNLRKGSSLPILFSLPNFLRNRQQITIGVSTSTSIWGNIAIGIDLNTTNVISKKMYQINIGYSNRNGYRIRANYISGINAKHIYYTASVDGQYIKEGMMPGTFYKRLNAFFSLYKLIGWKHILSLQILVNPQYSGLASSATKELFNITGSRLYNANWGWFHTEKKNASIYESFLPTLLFSYQYDISARHSLSYSLAYTLGYQSISGIDYMQAPNPNPSYYRYLPSFQTNIVEQNRLLNRYQQNPTLLQINWDRLYEVNQSNTTAMGHHSLYIIGNRVAQIKKLSTAMVYHFNKNYFDIHVGSFYQSQWEQCFKRVKDLLGGDYWIDWNVFAKQAFPNNSNAYQSNMLTPNRIVKVGDHYGYNYVAYIQQLFLWMNATYSFKKIDMYIAPFISHTQMYRKGYYQNGLFPDASLGKSPIYTFLNVGSKGSFIYKINGIHYMSIGGFYITQAPYFDNLFISPTIRNATQTPQSEIKYGGEISYYVHSNKVKTRLTCFYTQIKNQIDVLRYYDDDVHNYVNYVLSNISKEYMGVELGLEYNITASWALNSSFAMGNYIYKNRMRAEVVLDNSNDPIRSPELVYTNKMAVPNTPQTLANIGIRYSSPAYWWTSVCANFCDRIWSGFNPIRRTSRAIDNIADNNGYVNDENNKRIQSIIEQTRLPMQIVVNWLAGYSLKIPKQWVKRRMFASVYASIQNLLNNTNLIYSAYEQYRFDFNTKNINTFPLLYQNGLGIVYNLQLMVSF